MKRIGYCSRCGKCCNVNYLPNETHISSTREDGTCTYLHEGNFCLKSVTVSGKPKYCQLFPTCPEDIAKIPECTYKFIEDE